MALRDYLDKAANVGMGALETINAPFQVAGEAIRGASEGLPLKMATAADQSGYRWPSIVQRLAPSTRTDEPPVDPFMKSYQGLEGLANLPRGVQAASDVVTGPPDLGAQIGGFGLSLGVMPPVAKKIVNAEIPEALANERGAIRLGKGEPYYPPGSPEREAAFNKWFGKSKAVDESGKPIEVYHGTTHRFDTFSPEKANVENHYGKGYYFTDSLDDVNTNYAGEGPDLTSRIDRRMEQIILDQNSGAGLEWGTPAYKTAQEKARSIAKKELSGETPSVMPVHLKLKNPVILEGPGETSFEINYNERTGKESGSGMKLYNALIDEAQAYGVDGQKLWGEVMDKIGDSDFTARQFEDAFRSLESLYDVTDDVGDLASSELLRKIYQKAGFDGVVMDADKAFGGQRRLGKPMEMDWGTKHYIAFEPTQIKSATGNRGTFNPRDPNITHAVPIAVGAGAVGATAGAEADQENYAEGGVVLEETDMPFQSEAQRGFMYAKHPKIAKRFEEETPKNAKLPEHVKKMNRGGVAGDWKDDLAGYMDEHFSGKEKPQSMAGGGFAGDFDVDMGDSVTARGIPSSPPPPSTPAFNPRAGLPPPPPIPLPPQSLAPAVMASASPVAPPPSAPSGPDPLQGYLAEQRAALNRYGPEEQLALERSLQKQRTGFVPVLANAATGLADAIMQGVARAGPSNFQSNLENRIDKTQEGQRSALKNAQTGHLTRMKQEMELAQIDPESPISRLAQRSATPLLKSLGLSDDEIRNIPASLVGEAQTRQLTLEEIRTKAEETRALREQNALLMGEGLDIRREGAREAARKARVEEATKAKETRLGAAKDILTKSGNARFLGVPIPWTSDVSAKDKKMALETLREGMQPDEGYEPDVVEYARTHGITPQAALIQKQRRMRTPAGAR